MKAILKYPLYRRLKATNEADAVGYLPEGSVIEVESIINGKSLEGISIWFQANDGFKYWGGGAEFYESEPIQKWALLPHELQISLLNSAVSEKEFLLKKNSSDYYGCGWGYKNEDLTKGLAITVFVGKKKTNPEFEKYVRYKGIDIPLDVKEIESFSHHLYDPNAYGKLAPDIDNPMQMGGSIARENTKIYGTRSLFLLNKDRRMCLMTCFHVLLPEFKKSGSYISKSESPLFAEMPATEANPFDIDVAQGFKILEGRYNSYYDHSVVEIANEYRFRNAFNNQDFNGFYLIEDLQNLVGKEVTMAGAKSIFQKGKVLDVKGLLYINGNQPFCNVIVTEKMSMPGDSGAPVVDSSNKLVGIIIGGNQRDRTLILPVTFLFTQLGYKLL